MATRRHISFKLRKLLTWLGVDENTRQMLNIEALRIKDTVTEIIEEEKFTVDLIKKVARKIAQELSSI